MDATQPAPAFKQSLHRIVELPNNTYIDLDMIVAIGPLDTDRRSADLGTYSVTLKGCDVQYFIDCFISRETLISLWKGE